MLKALFLLILLLLSGSSQAVVNASSPQGQKAYQQVTTTSTIAQQLNSTTVPQQKTYNPAAINGLGQDLGKFSVVISLTSIQWNVTNSDYLQFNPPTVGPTALSNVVIYYNSTEMAWQMTTGLNTVAVYVKPGTYAANIFIQANLASAQQVCLPFNAPSVIVQQTTTNKTNQTVLLPSVKSGNEIFSWSDIPGQYSPLWSMNKLCLSLPIGTSIIDPVALDGSGAADWNGGASKACGSLTTTHSPDIIMLMIIGNPSASLSNSQVSVSDTSSLSWTLRGYFEDGTSGLYESWFYAKASGTLSSDVITATITRLSTAMFNGRITCFGVSGANQATPFDPNGALPTYHSDNSGVTHPSVTFSTSNANDFLFGTAIAEGGAGLSPPSGFTFISGGCSSFSCEQDYQVVSSTQSSVTATWGGDVDTNLAGMDAIQQAANTVSQGIKITTAPAGAPSGTITITGCSPSNSTFTANGNTHTYTLTASCTVTLTGPSTTYTRYDFNISPKPAASATVTFSTCASGTCTLYQNTTYYQLLNNFTEIAQTPNKWDADYQNVNFGSTNPPGYNDLIGTFLGTVITSASPYDLCSLVGGAGFSGGSLFTRQGLTYGYCERGGSPPLGFIWSDYGTGCWPSEIGNTWSLQTACPAPTTGNNVYLGYYVQSTGGGAPTSQDLPALALMASGLALIAIRRRRRPIG